VVEPYEKMKYRLKICIA